jgi:hypothetical protein
MAALVALVTLAGGTLAGAVLAKTRDQMRAAVAFGGYAAAFSLFLIGFCVWTRSRSHAGGVPRVLGLGALFLALLGPYIALAIAGILTDSGEHIPLFAAPSPAFAFVGSLTEHRPHRSSPGRRDDGRAPGSRIFARPRSSAEATELGGAFRTPRRRTLGATRLWR